MTITAHGLFVAGWVAALLAWLFAAYHYIAFYQKFERARLAGMIPQTLLRRRMAIGWFLATAEWVPGGAYHRRYFAWALGAFCAIWLMLALLSHLFET